MKMTANETESYCSKNGGMLATIDTEDKQDSVQTFLDRKNFP